MYNTSFNIRFYRSACKAQARPTLATALEIVRQALRLLRDQTQSVLLANKLHGIQLAGDVQHITSLQHIIDVRLAADTERLGHGRERKASEGNRDYVWQT